MHSPWIENIFRCRPKTWTDNRAIVKWIISHNTVAIVSDAAFWEFPLLFVF